MIRYIDLGNQILDEENMHFAFFCTFECKFKEFSGVQDWNSIKEFKEDFDINLDINRYLELIPDKWK